MADPTPLARPTLLPGLARLWRDRHTLQLGIEPGRAVLLKVTNPRAARLLDLLDGTRSERAVLAYAATARVAPDEARVLLDTLRGAGLVVPAQSLLPRELAGPVRTRLAGEADALALATPALPGTPAQVLRRRRAARVLVTGAGRLGAAIAVALAQAGVGHVAPELPGPVRPGDLVGTGLTAAEVGRPLAAAVRAELGRSAPGTETGPLRRGRVDLVVQLGTDRPAALLATGYAQRRQPHLLVDLRGGVPVIGPLVRPPVGPCLNCLDLHRVDRDPDWPTLAAQLAADDAERACAATTRLAAVAYAAAEALAHLDGSTPETLGCAVEVAGAGRFRRRQWPPHPSCGCSGRRPIRVRPTGPGFVAAVGPPSR
ncbi:TOMM precursor leader peptide-binding protein [Micromonospora sp. DR5-3]|uniref:TOMM precursor leader peptide-binding protein n=1 Tax=unclassified Micromonospora TaxID=2617518 RepID=UPI0011D50534|nr:MULTISPECIES: TOMM precursor leader peptide-binding protein [unclassified Micromonospora]MCW3814896.1 TOMM precursor leader peptide-binding protein [Micromonospora sp. DR5-3]TYC24201.1 TOMM precursor leader peptide-binding protein [Micromonospora sp. MP36]